MKANLYRTSVATTLLAACGVVLVLISGCNSSNKMAAVEACEECPSCHVETRVQPITGLTYTTCICPECKKVSTLDSSTKAAVEAYTGGDVGEAVHVCDACGAIVEVCSVCRHR